MLKPGGHFSISDIVTTDELPSIIKSVAELYAGCVSGTIKKEEYLRVIREIGFINLRIQKEKIIDIPDEQFLKYITKEEFEDYRRLDVKILSINVYAEKPFEPVVIMKGDSVNG